jgi:carbonic anhydrase
MRLFEAILEANRQAVSGNTHAAGAVSIDANDLPIAALTCIDARLNHLMPEALGIPEEKFIWLRNAGNIITSPLSSTMRSLAMACAIKGAKEIAIIGHTDCLVGKTTAMNLLDRLAALGVDRSRLPENLVEYFGLFGTERQNVLKAVEHVRASPLIGAKIPVHGLLIDLKTGKLEWLVNGYQGFATAAAPVGPAGKALQKADDALETLGQIGNLALGEMKFPETKIGELVGTMHDWVHKAEHVAAVVEPKLHPPPAVKPAAPPPLPPPLSLAEKLRLAARRGQK